MDHVHQRFLQHFLEQDIVGHMELEADDDARPRPPARGDRLRRPRRLHAPDRGGGEEEAVDVIERFVEGVRDTLPDDARVIKTIGDEVMVVGSDAAALSTGRSASRSCTDERPLPRIGIHPARRSTATATTTAARSTSPRGSARARRAARCWSRARWSTPPAGHLAFERIGEVKLKGFSEPTELFLARRRGPDGDLEARGRRRAAAAGRAGRVVVLLSGRPRLGLPARPRGPDLGRGDVPRCTSTTGCATPRRATPPTAPRCASGSACRCRPPPAPPEGNLQAWARDSRYAEAVRGAPAATTPPAGHTASDQVETVLYRLAASPGRRALLGMARATGRLVRPLLGVWRDETAAWCAARGLPGARTPSNATPAFARNRARLVLPALRALHPAAEANVLRTLELLRDEAAVLDAAVDAALAEAGDPPADDDCARCRPRSPGWSSSGSPTRPAARVGHRTAEILALAERRARRRRRAPRHDPRAAAARRTDTAPAARPA